MTEMLKLSGKDCRQLKWPFTTLKIENGFNSREEKNQELERKKKVFNLKQQREKKDLKNTDKISGTCDAKPNGLQSQSLESKKKNKYRVEKYLKKDLLKCSQVHRKT